MRICVHVYTYMQVFKRHAPAPRLSFLCQSPPSVYVLCHGVFVTPLQDTTASADERDACLLRHTTVTHYCNTTTATQLLKAEKKREGVVCQGKVVNCHKTIDT